MSVKKKNEQEAAELRRFNEVLQTLREKLSLRQADVARAIGMDQGAISKAAKGANKGGISERMLHLLRAKLGVNPEWVRGGAGEMLLAAPEPGAPVVEAPAGSSGSEAEATWQVRLRDDEARLLLAYRALGPKERPGIARMVEDLAPPASEPADTDRSTPAAPGHSLKEREAKD